MSIEFKKFQTVVFFSLLLAMIVLFGWMITPYIYPLFWAIVISILFYPLYAKLHRKTGNAGASAGLTVCVVVLVVIIPVTGILGLVIQQAFEAYELISRPSTITDIQNTFANFLAIPRVNELVTRFDLIGRLRAFSETLGSIGVQWLTVWSRNTVTAVVQFIIMLYSSYYFLKDGDRWLKRLMHLIPLGDDNEAVLIRRFVSTTKATLKGTVLIGIIQGSIGGVLFALIGIPGAAFWGLIMIIAAIIPAVGTSIVWIPAAIYLFATQAWTGAIIITIGGLFMGAVDNFIRPPLVGKDTQMHPLVILFSTIGGIGVFGISGVVIGPVIAAFLLSVLTMYEQRYKKEL